MDILATVISPHTVGDIEFYACFLIGQFLFLLKRAGSAIRNQNTTIHTRRAFFWTNWDIISVRTAVESLFIYYPFHHYSIAQLLSFFSVDPEAIHNVWLEFFLTIPSSAVSAIALGFVADSILDWAAVSTRVPSFIQKFIKEKVPVLPEIQATD